MVLDCQSLSQSFIHIDFFFIFQWCGLAYDDECMSFDYSYGLSLLLLLLLLFIMRHFLFNNINIFYIFQIFYKI